MSPLSDHEKWAHTFLFSSSQEEQARKLKEKMRDGLKPYIMANFPQDEGGNHIYEFPSPIMVSEDERYSGLKAQRRVSEWIDEDKARELIDKHNLWDRCVKYETVEVIDYDELYAANQEGIVSDEDIDDILESSVTYALVRVKA